MPGRSTRISRETSPVPPSSRSRGVQSVVKTRPIELAHLLTSGTAAAGESARATPAVGQEDQAQQLRWAAFEERLSSRQLRAYLKKLPDFDDVEAEERAIRHALGFRSFPAALDFLRGWPDQARTAQVLLGAKGEPRECNHFEIPPREKIPVWIKEEEKFI